MTPEGAALGFPQSTLATHTEARAVKQYPLEQGDVGSHRPREQRPPLLYRDCCRRRSCPQCIECLCSPAAWESTPKVFRMQSTLVTEEGCATWADGKTTLQWDYQHGAVEKYSKNGTHLGGLDPNDGSQNKPGDPGGSPSGC
jgi:Cytotoxic/Pput_2613-like deaminase